MLLVVKMMLNSYFQPETEKFNYTQESTCTLHGGSVIYVHLMSCPYVHHVQNHVHGFLLNIPLYLCPFCHLNESEVKRLLELYICIVH